MQTNITTILKDYCSKSDIEITDKLCEKFETLSQLLLDYNSHTNLTAIKDSEGIAIKHFADSIAPLAKGHDLIPSNAKVVDVGCGAGFPGLPLAIMRDDINVTFIDSTEKKLKFTKSVGEALSLGITCRVGRAEELSSAKEMRESFDVAVSRAVATLPVLCELCLPFVAVGGLFIAYKASGASEELELAKKAIPTLGGRYVKSISVELPQCNGEALSHTLIVIKKVSSTQSKYPRRYAQILKSPL